MATKGRNKAYLLSSYLIMWQALCGALLIRSLYSSSPQLYEVGSVITTS